MSQLSPHHDFYYDRRSQISDVCRVRKNPDEVEADPGAKIVTLRGVRHFISAQTVISVISGSLPHFSLNPAPVFSPAVQHHSRSYPRAHTLICLHITDTVWLRSSLIGLAQDLNTQTKLCKSVIELGLRSQLARAKACQSCLPGH